MRLFDMNNSIQQCKLNLSSRGFRRVLFVDREGASSIWSIVGSIVTDLEGHGWDCGLVAMSDNAGITFQPKVTKLGSRLISVPRKYWAGDLLRQWWAFEKGFAAVLREWRPDVVHVNFAIPGIWARRVAKRMGVPLVVSTQHELWGSMSWHLRLGLRATRGCVDVHTYVSEAVAKSFGAGGQEPLMPRDELRTHTVIRNGVDELAIEAAAREVAATGASHIVAPGRLVPVKGHRRILTAFARIRDQYPDAKLLIPGSGPEESSLLRLAKRLDIVGAVKFMGWLPRAELLSLMASAKATVFASDGTQEGFGLALAEAALLGTPLVVSEIAAFREVLAEDDQAAWWFQPADTDAMAQALMQALSASSDERDCRAQSARHAAKARATRRVMVEQYAQLYDRLASRLR